jgi:hypothetical protein
MPGTMLEPTVQTVEQLLIDRRFDAADVQREFHTKF